MWFGENVVVNNNLLNNFFCIPIFQVYDIYSSEQCDEHSDIHAILRLLNIRFGRETRVQQADCWIFRQGPGKFDPFQSLSTSSVSLKISQCQEPKNPIQ